MRRVALMALLVLSFSIAAAYAGNKTYVNPRFGTTITFPDAIFTKSEPAPENGDGQRWTTSDGASLAVWGQNNTLDFTPETIADFVAKDFGEITFRKVGSRWMVVSGYVGTDIIYHRAEFGRDGVIHSMELRYPVALRKHYDTLSGIIADSLIGP